MSCEKCERVNARRRERWKNVSETERLKRRLYQRRRRKEQPALCKAIQQAYVDRNRPLIRARERKTMQALKREWEANLVLKRLGISG